jgi:choline dehydrogenase-like flavoprotein
MKESDAYPQRYQENLGRRTKDGGVGILQGRTVGGGTVVNWATSFRTPDNVLKHWQSVYGLTDLTTEKMAPWFAAVEARLGIKKWSGAQNANNAVLSRGLTNLGLKWNTISPNVRGCANLGYCGLGCPINAKQSMLVTTLPSALAKGATLVSRLRAERLLLDGKQRVVALRGLALQADGIRPSNIEVTIRARHFIVAGGAIGSPALLMRSGVPDPHGLLGQRTFLHPTVVSAGVFKDRVDGYAGAPQSIYSDHFLHQHPIDKPLRYSKALYDLLNRGAVAYGVAHIRC